MADKVIETTPIKRDGIEGWLLGTAPYCYNAMSAKVKRDLLFPPGPKTTADKAATLKHDPLAEYRGAVYRCVDGPTLLGIPAAQVKGAMMSGALDMPGATKAQIGRLVYVEGDMLPFYGTPKLYMSVTRMANVARTPDVRTRAIVQEWAVPVRVLYARPMLTGKAVANILSAAGIIAGVGDYRVQKGKGSFGTFEIVSADDERVQALLEQGREVQQAAYDEPEMYDVESTELFSWWASERERTGKGEAA
jgi:hypothetical protein